MKRLNLLAGLAAGVLLAGVTSVSAATRTIHLHADMDPNGYFTEDAIVGGGGSMAFAATDPDGADAFYTLNDAVFSTGVGGSYTTGSRAGSEIYVFPNGTSFYWGSVSFDDSTLSGVGVEVLPITSASLDVSSSIDQGLDSPTTVTGLGLVFFDSPAPITFGATDSFDTITFVDGEPVGINLSVTTGISFDVVVGGYPYLSPSYAGTFTITGTGVQFSIADDYTVPFVGTSNMVWDLPGTLLPLVVE